ncbi:MAG: ATP-binding protein [Melioribacteraceae bacterium]
MYDNYKEKYNQLYSALTFIQHANDSIESVDELITHLNRNCCSLTKCRVSSLFLLNTTTFEFELSGPHTSSGVIEVQKAFNDLLDVGLITEVLMSGSSVQKEISNYENVHLVPLKSNKMIYAILLMIFDNKTEFEEDGKSILSSLIAVFALRYFSLFSGRKNTVTNKERTTTLLDQIENLKQSRADLHKILDSLHEGIFIVNKTTKQIADVNQTAEQLILTNKESLIGRNKDDFFLFFDTTMFREEIITSEEALLVNINGTTIPIIYTTTDIQLGGYDYQIVSFLDISERKKMEDKIQQSRFELEFIVEDRTRELLNTNKELEEEIAEREKAQEENLKLISAIEQTNSLITITNLESEIEYVNNAVVTKTGYLLDELAGKTPVVFKGRGLDAENYRASLSAVKEGTQWSGEHMMRKKNGQLFWVSTHISPIKNSKNEIIKYMAVQEDITVRKNAELQILNAKEKVEKAEKAKSSLLANMSHEFRTPLISILGFSELLEYDLTDKEQIEMVHAIQSGGKRLLNSLESILLLSHLESSNLNFAMKKVNIIPLIHSSVKLFTSEARKKFLDLNFESSLVEIMVSTEEKYFSQTINHLVDNAIKYTAAGEIRITLDYTIENNMDYVLISIHDTGIGIDEEDQAIIFEAFRQASEGYNRNYEGFGLGLTIAQKTIHLMNGKISVKSKPDEGSIFTIWLPFSSIK